MPLLTPVYLLSRQISFVAIPAAAVAWLWLALRVARRKPWSRPCAAAVGLTSIAAFVLILPWAVERDMERYDRFVDAQAKELALGSLCGEIPKTLHGYREYGISRGDRFDRYEDGRLWITEHLEPWQRTKDETWLVDYEPDRLAGVEGAILSDFPGIEITCDRKGRVASVKRTGS